jgi:hypothetical protein
MTKELLVKEDNMLFEKVNLLLQYSHLKQQFSSLQAQQKTAVEVAPVPGGFSVRTQFQA